MQSTVLMTKNPALPLQGHPADKPLKFVQVETFYPFYLNKFYQERPGLSSASYEEQMKALLDDGFAAAHIFAPAMKNIGYEAHYIIANAPLQLAWLREHGMPVPDGGNIASILRQQLDILKPDVLYLNDAVVFDSPFIRTLERTPPLVMGWHASPIPSHVDWSAYDVILSALSALREAAVTFLGAKAGERFMPAFPEWILPRVEDVRPECDVLFAGQYTTRQHVRRGTYLEALTRLAAGSNLDYRLLLSGQTDAVPGLMRPYCRPPAYGIDMFRALRSARIAMDSRSEMVFVHPKTGVHYDLAGRESANMRLIEATGAGSFLLAEHYDNLSEMFAVGTEIETFSSTEELVDKVRYYLSHPQERMDIAERGHRRCLQDHSMAQRSRQLDAIIRKHLAAKEVSVPAPAPQPEPRKDTVTVEELRQRLMNHVSVIAIDGIERIGTKYGGWPLPNWRVRADSICYCAGAGEDISVEAGLAARFGCTVFILDPAPRAARHFADLAEAVKQDRAFPIDHSATNFYSLDAETFGRLRFLDWGLYKADGLMRFYGPQNEKSVSHSIKNLRRREEYFDAQCYTVKTVMELLGHQRIDLLKIDIEGAEYDVVGSVIDTGLRPGVLCVEFEEGHTPVDVNFVNRIFQTIRQLERYGYALVAVDAWTFTFMDIRTAAFW